MAKGHTIKLAGVDLVPDLSGALYVPDYHSLLVADLHLEHGTSLARRGLHAPPFDSHATLAALEAVIAATRPWRLVLLGDSFHDAVAHQLLAVDVRERIARITAEVETVWISGNHDPAPPVGLGGVHATYLALGPIMLRHEPAPLTDNQFEIAGHLHPGARIVQRGHGVRAKCFVSDDRRLIMPAFGSYTGAMSVRSAAFDGLFSGNALVTMLGRNSLHRFPVSRVA